MHGERAGRHLHVRVGVHQIRGSTSGRVRRLVHVRLVLCTQFGLEFGDADIGGSCRPTFRLEEAEQKAKAAGNPGDDSNKFDGQSAGTQFQVGLREHLPRDDEIETTTKFH